MSDFYEDDEPIEDIVAIANRPPSGVTSEDIVEVAIRVIREEATVTENHPLGTVRSQMTAVANAVAEVVRRENADTLAKIRQHCEQAIKDAELAAYRVVEPE